MKVYTLMDNVACSHDFAAEFGLSYYIETDRHRILFDSGSTPLFARNAEKLGIDLSKVDIAVLSHGHFDHGGGLLHFLDINDRAKVYVARGAFDEYFNGKNEYIGLSSDLAQSNRLVYIDGMIDIDEEISLIRPFPVLYREEKSDSAVGHSEGQDEKTNSEDEVYPLKYPIESYGLKVFRSGGIVEDDFSHELYLVLKHQSASSLESDSRSHSRSQMLSGEMISETGISPKTNSEKRIVFSGCSHRGILNIMSWFAPDVLFGGFHLFRVETYGEGAEKLKKIAEELLQYPTMYYTCHCTGISQYEFLSSMMEERIRYLAAGEMVELD